MRHLLAIVLAAVAPAGYADDIVGEIRICRTMSMVGSLDHLPVEIPAGATFVSTHDDSPDTTLFKVIVDDPLTIGAKKSDCVTAKARVLEASVPIKAGRRMTAQWAIGGFEPAVKVTKDFK